MKQVFRVKVEPDKYQYFLPTTQEEIYKLRMDCTPRKGSWLPPEVYIPYPKRKAGDFYHRNSFGVMIASRRATERLNSFFSISGEQLQLPYNREIFTLVNVLNCLNCLDQDKTEWRMSGFGTRLRPLHYQFHPERIFGPIGLFKIPETCSTEILIWIDTDASDDDNFIAVVEANGLEGLMFEKLWEEHT